MVSKEQFLEIRRCHEKGMSANEIAQKVGVSAPSVRKWWNVEEKMFDELIQANYAIINRIAAENSTRTPETSMRQLAAYCAEPGNHFLEQLEAGTPELNNHELDHLIWYAYKNDSIRSEVAKALAKALV